MLVSRHLSTTDMLTLCHSQLSLLELILLEEISTDKIYIRLYVERPVQRSFTQDFRHAQQTMETTVIERKGALFQTFNLL